MVGLEKISEFFPISDGGLGLEGNPADVGVKEGVCTPAIELELSAEELFAVILCPLFFRTVLSHIEIIAVKHNSRFAPTFSSRLPTTAPPRWNLKRDD